MSTLGFIPMGFRSALDPYQLRAATCGVGPKRCNAAAGSGKTTTYAHRIVFLVGNGVKEENILATTFTKKAANEMKERIEKVAKKNDIEVNTKEMWIGTFHSLGIQAIRLFSHVVGYNDRFTIIDDDDQEAIFKKLIAESGSFKGIKLKVGDLISAVSYARNSGQDYYDVFTKRLWNVSNHLACVEIAEQYEKTKHEMNVLDFDDMLIYWLQILQQSPTARNFFQDKFHHILVDEYQDTNFIQNEIIDIIAAKHRNLFVVGDDYQCLPGDTEIITSNGTKMIKDIQKGDRVLSALGQGETGFCEVDHVFKRTTREDLYEITTESGRKIQATHNHIFFADLGLQKDIYYVYLMYKKGFGFRIGKTQGARSSGKKHDNGLRIRVNQERADAAWILEAVNTEEEALRREQYISHSFGIPQIMFEDRGVLGEHDIKAIMGITNGNILRIVDHYQIDLSRPHVVPQGVHKANSHKASVRMNTFSGSRKSISVRLESSDPVITGSIISSHWRPAKNGQRIEVHRSHDNYDEMLDFANRLSRAAMIPLVQSAKIMKKGMFSYTPASHLRAGMVIPVLDSITGELVEDTIISVERLVRYRDHDVYDLSVPNARNFIANGVVVHNSIYAFRAAEVNNIISFDSPSRYPDAESFVLANNYRCTPEIVELAQASITQNTVQLHKEVKAPAKSGSKPVLFRPSDEVAQARKIVGMIKRLHNDFRVPYKEMAILYRNNNMTLLVEQELNKNLIPYVKKGAQFWKKAHIKLALSWIKIAQNPLDKANMARCAEMFDGIGKAAIQKLMDAIKTEDNFHEFVSGQLVPDPKKPALYNGLRTHLQEIENIIADSEDPVKDGVGYIVNFLIPYCQTNWKGEEGTDRAEDLSVLIDLAEQFESIQELLEAIALQEERSNKKKDRDEVTLSTGHGAKGLEWGVVFMIGLVSEMFPSKFVKTREELEEERRLFYVMLTRAKQKLYMFSPCMVKKYGEEVWVDPSMFLEELPPELMDIKNS